jgi:membrane protein DedA with SNARE-associated domain
MPAFSLLEWIKALETLYDQYGYLIVFLGALGENTALLGLLLPGNSLALLGAFYARLGTLQLGWVIFFAWLGTVIGYHIDYLLGRYALAYLTTRWGKTTLGRRLRLAGHIRLAQRMLYKHGGKAILISHVVGHLRSFVALSAGITRMKYHQFLLFEAIAALLWNTAFSLLGYLVAVNFDLVERIIGQTGGIIFTVLVLAFLVWKWWQRKKREMIRQRKKNVLSDNRQQRATSVPTAPLQQLDR